MTEYNLNINTRNYVVRVPEDKPLLWVLRDDLNLTGTKYGCGIAQCGSCTILINDTAVRSCVLPISAINDSRITTIEGALDKNHKILEAWEKYNVPQCGYCQAGQVMSTLALLKKNKSPKSEDIENYLNGNICRCGTYNRIRKAISYLAES